MYCEHSVKFYELWRPFLFSKLDKSPLTCMVKPSLMWLCVWERCWLGRMCGGADVGYFNNHHDCVFQPFSSLFFLFLFFRELWNLPWTHSSVAWGTHHQTNPTGTGPRVKSGIALWVRLICSLFTNSHRVHHSQQHCYLSDPGNTSGIPEQLL